MMLSEKVPRVAIEELRPDIAIRYSSEELFRAERSLKADSRHHDTTLMLRFTWSMLRRAA